MMSVSPREAHPSQYRISLAAARVRLLLILLGLLALCGPSAFAQGLSPGNPVSLGSVDLQQSTTKQLTFSTTPGGADIASVTVVTEGIANKDFTLASDNGCVGSLPYPDQCTITINFSPKQIGIRLGALIITDSGGAVVNLINLSGIGVGPQFVFQPATFTTLDTASGLTPSSFTAGTSVQDPGGDIIFTDVANNRILEENSLGLFSVLYSGSPLALSNTSGLVIDGTGNLYISSGANVYVLAPGATTLTVLPTPGVTLTHPTGLTIDTAGDLYIADSTTGKIYQDVLGGNFAQPLTLTGPGATLAGPTGLAIDENNNVYIADSGNNRIVEFPITTLVTTVLPLTPLTLNNPTGVAIDPAGTVYIADTGNHRIVEATVLGDQFVLTETPALTLDTPAGVLIEGNGDMVISDTTLGLVTVVRSTPAINFPTPTVIGTLDTTDDPETLTVQESGNIASSLVVGPDPAFSGTNPTAFQLAATGTCPSLSSGAVPTAADVFSIGEVCTYNLNFDPTVVGPNTANLVLSTATAGGVVLTSSSTASLFGIGLSTLNHFTLVAISNPPTTPTTINLGGSVELVLTAIQTDGQVATDYTGTITFTTTDGNGLYKSGPGAGTNTTTFTMTAADNGVLTIPVASGLQLNLLGVFTATAVADPASIPPSANGTAVSNPIFVVEPSTLTLTSSVNPSLVNQTTVFTLTISTTGTNAPGGMVSFFNGTTLIGTETVTSTSPTTGTASISDSFPATGSYPIKAVYTSTTDTAGGTATLTQFVGYTTTATLTSSVNPVDVNANTTLTATIKSSTGTPTGIVTFKSNGITIGTGTLSGGVATLVTSFPLPGTYTLIAVYNGDANDQGATTNTVLETVLNVVNISLISSVNPVFLDNPTILTATLTTVAVGTAPTGTISFFDGSTPIGTGTIANGTVSVTASFVYAGTHTLTAVYSGDAADAPGTSPAYAQTVADFSLAVASGGSATGSAIAGGTVTYPLVVTPIITSTLPGPITLTFSGLPASVTGTLTPATIATGSGATPVAFAVTAAPLSLTAHLQRPPAHHSRLSYAPITLALLALPLAWLRRRKRFASLFASLCLLFAITAGLSGCVSAPNTGYYGQTPQTYNLTVTATSGNLSRSTYLTLTVQ
jgi:large repetitive protein